MSIKKASALICFCAITGLLIGLTWSCSPKPSNETVEIDYLSKPVPGNTPAVFLPGVISKAGRFEMGFSMSPDGKTMAYGVAHESDSNQTNLYFIQRENEGWSQPRKTPLPQNHNVFFPMFGPDGQQFYFARAIPNADTDLWVGDFKKGEVAKVKPLQGTTNSEYREAGHGMTKDGLFLFTSNRDQAQPWGGDVYQQTEDGQVEKVAALSSEWDEESLFLSPNGDYVIIQAWKPEFKGKHDLYISYRMIDGAWTAPQRLNEAINTLEIEQRPFVSPDLKYLFFNRMSVEQQGEETLFDSDVYWVGTEKVFAPFLYKPVSRFEVESNKPFSINLPKNTFGHITDSKLQYKITSSDDDPLPAHFHFDEKELSLKGNLTQESMVIKVTAIDADGQSASLEVEILGK